LSILATKVRAIHQLLNLSSTKIFSVRKIAISALRKRTIMKIYFNFLVYFYLSAQVALAQEENLKFRDSPLIERRTVMLQNRYFILGEPVLQRDVIKLMKP
jgi:hypothetical protein